MTLRWSSALFCNECGDWIEHSYDPSAGARKLREQARRHGWVFKDGQDLCPDCLAGVPVVGRATTTDMPY